MAEVRVLLVEDSDDDAALVRRKLAASADPVFRLSWVRSYEDALAELPTVEPDVVLADLRVPPHEGTVGLSMLLAVAGPTPVLVLTGIDDEPLALDALRLGADDYLIKYRMTPGTLRTSVLHALARAEARAMERDAFQLAASMAIMRISSGIEAVVAEAQTARRHLGR